MKVIAMYLPQFHRVKENDEWWGEGFTEWTSVKAAKPLFEGHNQPVVPYNDNYYDLSEKATMQWQADLMKQYGIDGVCMYHYWFKDGRQILERPAENLLQWKDIDMSFCFCWANETWAKTWSVGDNVNVWTSVLEKEKRLESSTVLLDQKYGWEKDWTEHFNYLLPFFKDDRYIKIDGKPVFMIYKTAPVTCFENMIDLWKELARQNGFNGVYIIGREGKPGSNKALDALFIHEPGTAIQKCCVQRKNATCVDYNEVWDKILSTKKREPFTVMGFSKYDDTPRHGSGGMVVEKASSEIFRERLAELLAKNELSGTELTFLNAWNEWGEGMYLEPDEVNRYQYLEGILYAKQNYHKYLSKYKEVENDSIETKSGSQGREIYLCKLLDQWLSLKEKGISIGDLLKKQGISRVAMYGYGLLGKHFYRDLLEAEVSIEYVIDRNIKVMNNTVLPVYFPQDELPEIDAVVVTATYAYGEIYPVLKEKGIKRIISLEHLISENI